MTLDWQYEELLQDVLWKGEEKPDRTGTGTYSLFGAQLRYDLSKGFPLITTKKVSLKSVVGELLWFLSGSTDTRALREKYGVTIWDEWADEEGDVGPMYGWQWRNFGGEALGWGVDQIDTVIRAIRTNPHSRRHVVSAWNPTDLPDMALAPCHAMFQFYVSADGKRLSCHVFQRSADVFLGVPYNIASYAALTHIIAQQTSLEVGELLWSATDVHLYKNHEHQATEQIGREVRPFPTLKRLPFVIDFEHYQQEDFVVEGYDPHPAISAPVAV